MLYLFLEVEPSENTQDLQIITETAEERIQYEKNKIQLEIN